PTHTFGDNRFAAKQARPNTAPRGDRKPQMRTGHLICGQQDRHTLPDHTPPRPTFPSARSLQIDLALQELLPTDLPPSVTKPELLQGPVPPRRDLRTPQTPHTMRTPLRPGRITSGRGGRHSERNDQHQHDKYHDRSRKRRHEPLPAPPRSVNNTPPLLFYRHRAHHTRGNNPLCTATTTPTPLHPTPIIWKAATRKARMRILLVHNHGPYTINLCRLIATVVGSTPTILTNDDKHWDHIDTNTFDALIISPGPGHPQNPHDLGHTLNLLNHTHLPVL